jgi:hypothetical protein
MRLFLWRNLFSFYNLSGNNNNKLFRMGMHLAILHGGRNLSEELKIKHLKKLFA